MLQKLHERIHGIIAWVVIGFVAITFTLYGVDFYMQSRQVNDVEVSVNGEAISKQSYEVNYRRIHQQREFEQAKPINDAQLRKQILDDMIFNLITIQAANNNGFIVSPEQATVALTNIPQFQQNGQFSRIRYQQALNAALYTPESFRNQVKQGMLLNQQRFAFMGSAFALPNEISQFVRLYMQTRDFEYVVIPHSTFDKNVQVLQPELAKYYIQHKGEFLEPEKVSIEYITLSYNDLKAKVHVSENDAKKYYQENQANFMLPASWEVTKLTIPNNLQSKHISTNDQKVDANYIYNNILKNPSFFDKYQRIYSAEKLPKSSDKKNNLWITAGKNPNIDKALAPLSKSGEVTKPIKTSAGYIIFKVEQYKAASVKSFEQVKSDIIKILTTDDLQTKYSQAIEQLSDLSYQTPDSLAPVSKALQLPIHQSELFTRGGGLNALTKNQQIINTAYSHDVLDLGNNSEPIQLDNESVIVLRIKQHIPVQQKKLEDIEEKIRAQLIREHSIEEAKKFGSLLLSKQISDEASLLKNYQLIWKPVLGASRDSENVDPQINELAFAVAHPNEISGKTMPNGDFIVVRLKQVHNGQYNDLDTEQQESLIQQIQASYGTMEYDLYVNGLVAGSKIEHAS